MRGAYYVATALLVAVSSQPTAKSEQANLQRKLDNDVAEPGSLASNTLSTRFLRGSRDLRTDLPLSAANEERMNFSVIAYDKHLKEVAAAEAAKIAAEIAAREAAKKDAAVAAKAAALAAAEKRAKAAPKKEAKAGAKKEAIAAAKQAAMAAAKEAVKAAVEAKLPSEETAALLFETLIADVLQYKMKNTDRPEIVRNAAKYLIRNYPTAPLDLPVIKDAVIRRSEYMAKVRTGIVENPLPVEQVPKSHLGEATDELDLSLEDQSGRASKKARISLTTRINGVYDLQTINDIQKRFQEETKLPFEVSSGETGRMLGIFNRKCQSSPWHCGYVKGLEMLAKRLEPNDLRDLLGKKGLQEFLGNNWEELQKDKRTLETAYTLKLIITYELFYSFCHNSDSLCFIGKSLSEKQAEESTLKRAIGYWLPDFRHQPTKPIESSEQLPASTSQLPH